MTTTPHHNPEPNPQHTPPDPSANSDRIAVVLMAYGTPRAADEILPYYTDIRRGRPPTDEALADLTERYEAIGGLSPLAELTEAQRDAVQAALDEVAPGRYHVTLGLKHAEPMIETAVVEVADAGFQHIIGAVLAPHYSSYSIGQYLGRATEAATPRGIDVVGVNSWAVEPAYVDFLVGDLGSRLDTMRAAVDGTVRVLFTAHSLPQRIIDGGDPYPDELRSTAEAVAGRLGLVEGDDWQIAWQSAGRTPEPWIGPDILDVIAELGDDDQVAGVIVSAVGFVADHLEVLYDLDIEASQHAERHELAFDRTACINDDTDVMGALAARIHELAP